MNLTNDRWLCKRPEEVPTVMHTEFLASMMVLDVVNREGDVTPTHFFLKEPEYQGVRQRC